ncbi:MULTISPECIES: hypothetical protein [unclassified Thioalkalivibrio]|uniref:hypothetical protein n=1 Tax=unclassified Thioalkalivibrio TaxID=2621013 RepID=UPI0003A553BE|nr:MULTISPECIES: hypothetical protein [unclassified Thioalkalivibrio]
MSDSVRMSGAEFRAFYSDPDYWPDGVWHDDEVILLDGGEPLNLDDLEALGANTAVEIQYGDVRRDTEGEVIAPVIASLPEYARMWRKRAQGETRVILQVAVSEKNREAVEEAVAKAGGSVL